MQVGEVLRIKTVVQGGNTLYTVTPDTRVVDCVDLMAQHDAGSLAVIAKGQLVGMLTFREVIAHLHRDPSHFATLTAATVMDSTPTIATPDQEMDELMQTMLIRHARYIPVLQEGMLLGVISFYDVSKALLEEKNLENRLLKGFIRDMQHTE
jgi:CBS domain-containing protein